jgi:methylmalonyl-CoA/ethylmalonyl-CoA epimerase
MIKGVAHVGIAVRSLERALAFYSDALGLPLVKIEEIGGEKARAALLRLGDTHIELLEPLSPDTALARFIEQRGEGLHHVALETNDAAVEMTQIKAHGVELRVDSPARGLSGMVFFLPPRRMHGVLVEIEEPLE